MSWIDRLAGGCDQDSLSLTFTKVSADVTVEGYSAIHDSDITINSTLSGSGTIEWDRTRKREYILAPSIPRVGKFLIIENCCSKINAISTYASDPDPQSEFVHLECVCTPDEGVDPSPCGPPAEEDRDFSLSLAMVVAPDYGPPESVEFLISGEVYTVPGCAFNDGVINVFQQVSSGPILIDDLDVPIDIEIVNTTDDSDTPAETLRLHVTLTIT